MKPIKVIENRFSKIICAYLDIPALTLGRYILLGCYENRYETLLKETTHFFQNRTIWWYVRDIFWKLIRK